MRVYYHTYPVCPNCHEPHMNGSPLEIVDDENLRCSAEKLNPDQWFFAHGRIDYQILKCSSCGVYFHSKTDMFSSDRFVETVETAISKGGKKAEKYLSGFTLPWEIRQNSLEAEYIQWVNKVDNGKFLITWPWREVKFIPILVSEYLLNNPSRKAVIVGDISSDSSGETEITVPDVKKVFDSLIYLEGLESNDIDETIKREMRQFDKKFVLIKKKIINYIIRRIGISRDRREGICNQNFIICKRRLIEEIKRDYGGEPIRKIYEKKMKSKQQHMNVLNENGFIDIKLEERKQWLGELHYNRKGLWNVLLNLENVIHPNRVISSSVLKDMEEEDPDGSDKRLFFIDSEVNPYTIFDFIRKISPDLVVIQNMDDFIKDVIYGGERSRAFFSFLKDCENSTLLMFSTGPDVRYLYNINRTEGYMDKYDIIPHTWDSETLIEKIKTDGENQESNYSSPVSSRWEELSDGGGIPEVEYTEVETLDDLDVFLDRVSSILVDNDVKEDIGKYIYDLKRSPLSVRGDYEKPEVFHRSGNYLGTLSYDYIMSIIHDMMDEEEFRSRKELFDKVYGIGSADSTNPLMKEIKGKVGDLLREKDSFLTVIVHGYDVRGTKKLLHEMGFDEYIPQRLSVSSWDRLNLRERDIADNARHYVISTLPPSLAYSIYSGHINRFIFIGSGNNIKKIGKIVKNRLTESISRPIYLLSDNDPAPELLKTVLKSVDIPSNEVLQNLSDEIFVEFDERVNRINDVSIESSGDTYHLLKPGKHAVLVVDVRGRSMFIPSGASLFIKEDYRLVEISLGNISSRDMRSKLENKEVLVDKHEIYLSFRSIFVKFMMSYGKKAIFRRGPYEWNGFLDLFNDATGWILILKKAISKYSDKNMITYEKAEEKFSEYLSSLNLTAKNPDYIRGWWTNYEIVETEYGAYHLYEIEHPISPDDIRKIYAGIKDILPEMTLGPADAERSYIASVTIQNFRRSLLKGNKKDIHTSLHQLYTQLEKEIKGIIRDAPVFKVKLAYYVEIIKEVEPFRVMDEYKEYILTSSDK